MFKQKKFLFVAAFLAVSLFLVACGDNGNSAGNDADDGNGDDAEITDEIDNDETVSENGDGTGHLVVAIAVEARTLDLHGTNDMGSAQVSRQIFETLVLQDEDMNIIPGLAHSWEQYNDRVWEFHLNDGVYFHNGDRLTAYDVEATLHRAAGAAQIAAIVGMIDPDTIEVVDELTIRVGTPEPFAPFLSHLAHSAAGIKNINELENSGNGSGDFDSDLDRLPVGTGPFQFSEWISGDRIVLTRFDDYHATIESRSLPAFDELTFRFIADSSVRVIALETGEIHIDLNPQADDFSRIENLADLRLEWVEGLRTEYLGMNVEHEHLSDQRVRQAINYAVDVEAIVNAIYQGHGSVGQTQLAANVFGHNPNIEGFPFDVDRALELMAEAGLEDGFSISLYANTERQDRVSIAQIVEQQLAAINIDVNIVTIEWAQMLNVLDEGNADLFLLGWTTVTGDGDYGLFPLLHTSQHGPPGNYTRFSNADVDRLLDAARESVDTEERLAFYFEAQEILREEAPWVVMLQERPSVFVNYQHVQNLVLNPIGTHFLGDVRLSE